jgi:hypothetical protein
MKNLVNTSLTYTRLSLQLNRVVVGSIPTLDGISPNGRRGAPPPFLLPFFGAPDSPGFLCHVKVADEGLF